MLNSSSGLGDLNELKFELIYAKCTGMWVILRGGVLQGQRGHGCSRKHYEKVGANHLGEGEDAK